MLDLTGQKFGRLTVISEAATKIAFYNGLRKKRRRWLCICECGNKLEVDQGKLRIGHTQSCGCYQKQKAAEAKTTHGYASSKGEHPIYHTWRGMMERCFYAKNENYHRYGKRGITVCNRWQTFEKFVADMEPTWSVGMTLERKNNNGNYEPSNCVWIPRSQQGRNTCRNRWIEFQGERLLVSDWGKRLGTTGSVITSRLQLGWTVEEALTTPVKLQLTRHKNK